MPSLVLLAILAFAVFIILVALKNKQGTGAGSIGFPYQPAKTLFSAAERSSRRS